jgi:hypothetical protein
MANLRTSFTTLNFKDTMSTEYLDLFGIDVLI